MMLNGCTPVGLVFDADWVNGLAMIRGLGRAGVEVIALSSRPKAVGFYSRYVSRRLCYPDPEHDPDTLIDILKNLGRELLDEGKKGVLFPTSDLLLKIFSDHQGEIDSCLLRTFPDASVLQAYLDKEKQYKIAAANDIPFPKTYYEEDLDVLKNDLDTGKVAPPLILKAAHSLTLENRRHFRAVRIDDFCDVDSVVSRAKARDIPFVIQEVIPGGDDCLYTFGSYRARDGMLKGIFTGRKLRQNPPGFGICRVGESRYVKKIIEYGETLLRNLNFFGISQIEFKYDHRDRQFKLMEINPRSWSWIGLPITMGINLPYYALCDAAGMTVPVCMMRNDTHVKPYIWMNIEDDLVVSLKMRDGIPWRHLFVRKQGFSEAFHAVDDFMPGMMRLREIVLGKS